MFKITHDKLDFALCSIGVIAGLQLAWFQVIAPGPNLSSIDRIVIGILGLGWVGICAWGVYAISRNQESAAPNNKTVNKLDA